MSVLTIDFPISNIQAQTAVKTKTPGTLSSPKTSWPQIIITASCGAEYHTTSIKYITGTTTGLDQGYDAGIFNVSGKSLIIYTLLLESSDEVRYGIQCLPDDDYENLIVPLGIEVTEDKEVGFQATVSNLPEGLKVYLEDKENDIFTDLTKPDSTYTINLQTGIYENRFYIHTTTQDVSLDELNSPEQKTIQLIPNYQNSSLKYSGKINKNAEILVIDLSGRTVYQSKVTTNEMILPRLKPGIYIAWLINGNNSGRQKFYWK